MKELLGECFTCTSHGIHENDEGLSGKFDTIVMQGLFDMKYECLLCFKLQLGHYHNVQRCQIVSKLTTSYIWKGGDGHGKLVFQRHCGFSQRMKNQPFIIRQQIAKQRNSLLQSRVYYHRGMCAV